MFDVRALLNLRRVSGFDVSPDGTWVAVAASEVDPETAAFRTSLWRVPTDGGAAQRLLSGPFDDSSPCFHPDGTLGFLSDRDLAGKEDRPEKGARKQVWILVAGEPQSITEEPLGVSAFRFARAASRMVLVTGVLPGVPHDNQRDVAKDRKDRGPSALRYRDLPVRHWDHWLPAAAPHFVCIDDRGRRDLTPDADLEYRDAAWDLSADGRTLVANHTHPGVARLPAKALAIFDLDSGTVRVVDKRPDVSHEAVAVSPDGRRIATSQGMWLAGEHGPCPLWVGGRDGTGTLWDPGTDLWFTPLAWRGDALVCAADVDGDRALFEVTEAGHRRLTGPGTYAGVPSHGAPYAVCHGTLQPPEVVALTEGAPALATLAGTVPHEVVTRATTRASDGADVPWWLVRPAGATGPLPTLVWIHGGPVSQWGDQWHWRWNPLVLCAAGWQVVLPNPRGSTGLGAAHVEGIWQNSWGARCFEDVMEVTDDVMAHPEVNADRVVAMGGSFGGYMTNWLGTQTDRFRCLITHASVFSFGTFYGTTDYPPYWSWMLGVDPFGDRTEMDRYSPERHMGGWRTPTLVIHGEKDYRVPISEGLALFDALRHHEVDAELLVFPDENHWIQSPRNIEAWYDAVIDFLQRKVAGRGSGGGLSPSNEPGSRGRRV